MFRLTLAAMMAAAALAGPTARADVFKMHATLDSATEVPPKQSEGKGTVAVTVDTATKRLDYMISYAGLTGPATAAHFHGPAAVGANGPVMVPIAPAGPSPLSGSVTLTDAQMTELLAGNSYVNVHTAANPSGEIRGQVVK